MHDNGHLLPAGSLTIGLSVETLLPWVRGIARGVRKDLGFEIASSEELELEGTAIILLVQLVERYDELRKPTGMNVHDHFKQCFSQWVRSEVRRECLRLRNGGLYRTTSKSEMKRLRVDSLSEEGEDGTTLGDSIPDSAEDGDESDEETLYDTQSDEH